LKWHRRSLNGKGDDVLGVLWSDILIVRVHKTADGCAYYSVKVISELKQWGSGDDVWRATGE
jgi:hypothetical protein